MAMTGYPDLAAAHDADARVVGSLPYTWSTIEGIDKRFEAQGKDDVLVWLSIPGEAARMAERLGLGGGIGFLLFMLGAYLGSWHTGAFATASGMPIELQRMAIGGDCFHLQYEFGFTGACDRR